LAAFVSTLGVALGLPGYISLVNYLILFLVEILTLSFTIYSGVKILRLLQGIKKQTGNTSTGTTKKVIKKKKIE